MRSEREGRREEAKEGTGCNRIAVCCCSSSSSSSSSSSGGGGHSDGWMAAHSPPTLYGQTIQLRNEQCHLVTYLHELIAYLLGGEI